MGQHAGTFDGRSQPCQEGGTGGAPQDLNFLSQVTSLSAQEVHCGHASLPIDPSQLVVPADPSDPVDDPTLSRMRGAIPQPLELPVAGAPPSYHDLVQVVGKGSPATSLKELPRPLMGSLSRYTLLVLAQVLQALSEGVPSRLLTVVLQLCLAKKQPARLVRNSRPVMLGHRCKLQ